jgi:SRSO17 transposase
MCNDYGKHFIVYRKNATKHARHYLTGLLGTQRRKNMGRIGEDVPESNYEGLQQFVSNSPWDHAALMEQLAGEAARLLGGKPESALYIDETSFVKKGAASVGVQRQYCGRLGKLENCQVGVFASLGCGERAALVDFRLFLPESWANDPARCEQAKVPPEERRHRTKCELALELVRQARARGLGHQWIGGDEVYGNNRELTGALDAMGEVYMMDVSKDLRVWEQKPGSVPSRRAGVKGRPHGGRAEAKRRLGYQSVSELARKHFEKQSRMTGIRPSTRGQLRCRLWAARVWLGGEGGAPARECWLVVRQEADGSFKYSLSNAGEQTGLERLGYMQSQRYWMERAFQDVKSELGMSQYEVRGWRGWHHHMSLCCLAQLFTLKARAKHRKEHPLLSARDIVELLAYYLPRKSRDESEVLAAMRARHAARQKDIQRRKMTQIRLTK